MIGRIVIGFVIMGFIWLVLTKWLGPIILTTATPVSAITGDLFVNWGWTIAVLAALWWWFWGYRRFPTPF